MATLHINEKVCARNCKKKYNRSADGPGLFIASTAQGQGKTGTSLPEGAAFPHILQHAINKATAVEASEGQICCWCQSAGCYGGRQMWLLLTQTPLEVPPGQTPL